ncbi:hypothetical protein QBC46DRAFT_356410 [Diplogelasinospora grovesii]|uniref:Extracellular membrane protein CFEM domain-containing protein n=1 Tax=Diplogelasinospora grovesii TaxID=303347 RepID=A0AAN6S2N8_9PEZI|nr:hypothetical protein QBC46DRAFT_356410 [Diplogelasinospora grovesii]
MAHLRSSLGWLLLLAVRMPFAIAEATSTSAGNLNLTQELATLPKCASNCLLGHNSTLTGLPITTATLCTDVPLQNGLGLCVAQNCTVKEALFSKNVTETICKAPMRDRSPEVVDVAVVLGTLSAVLVLLRVLFKLFVARRSLSPDDWFTFGTVMVGIPNTVIVVHGTAANGLGRDVWTVSYDTVTAFTRYFYVTEIFYFILVALMKNSLLFLYLRIFPSTKVRQVLWATVVFNAVFGVTFAIVAIFQCTPVSYFWEAWDGEHAGHCLSVNAMGWANAGISIALDLWMLAIPMAQIKTLNMHWKKKLAVGLMFGVGAFVTIVSIVRLQSLVKFANSSNPTWDNVDVTIWSTVEINVGIMCACLPTFRQLLVWMFPTLGSRARSGAPGGTGTYPVYYGCGNGQSPQAPHGHFASCTHAQKRASRSEPPPEQPQQQQQQRAGLPYDAGGLNSSQSQGEGGGSQGIQCRNSFAIKYSDELSDEEDLVPMRNLESGTGSATELKRASKLMNDE